MQLDSNTVNDANEANDARLTPREPRLTKRDLLQFTSASYRHDS